MTCNLLDDRTDVGEEVVQQRLSVLLVRSAQKGQ
jgi:hypothetical protein